MSIEVKKKKNKIVKRIPSFGIENTEGKRQALLANKHKVLTELGVSEQRRLDDQID